jgi:hypothetical protein
MTYVGLALAVVVSATLLGLQGTLDPQALTAILTGALGFAGGASVASGTLGQAVNGKASVPLGYLTDREATIRTALHATSENAAHDPFTDVPPLVPPGEGDG